MVKNHLPLQEMWIPSPRGGNSNPLQHSSLGNLTDRGAWRTTAHGLARVGHDLATKQQQIEGYSFPYRLLTFRYS